MKKNITWAIILEFLSYFFLVSAILLNLWVNMSAVIKDMATLEFLDNVSMLLMAAGLGLGPLVLLAQPVYLIVMGKIMEKPAKTRFIIGFITNGIAVCLMLVFLFRLSNLK